MTPGTILALILALLYCAGESSPRLSGLRQVITRNITGVRLDQKTVLDIVEEQTCSAALVRLTCRSLHSFIFVLEARYQPNRTDACLYNRNSWCMYKSLFANIRSLQMRRDLLRSNYVDDVEEDPLDFKSTINHRCSGRHHCRFRVTSDHPEALFWRPANVRIKYACVPEASVYRYCNTEIKVPVGEGGFLQSPGYPLYYLGGMSCEWLFSARPGQRIVITFHDLSIRDQESDGSCIDVVRIRDDGNTIYESCGTKSGVKVISNTNVITLNLISSKKLYPARGFFLQYQVLGCPDVAAPRGSYVSNGTLESRTFLCRARGARFPDTGLRTRTVWCKNGQWEQRISTLPGCTHGSSSSSSSSSSEIEADPNTISTGRDAPTNLDLGTFLGAGLDNTVVKTSNQSVMDLTKSNNGENEFVDFFLPSILIAGLFICNAFVVYVIFYYRKRNVDDNFRKAPDNTREELALGVIPNGNSIV